MNKVSAIIILGLIVASCKKDNATTNYFQFQKNDSTYTFDSVAVWVDTSVAFITTVEAKNTKTGTHLEMALQSNSNGIQGTYSHIAPQPTDFILISLSLLITSGPNSYSYATEGAPFIFTIYQANGSRIRGSFSGTLVALNSQSDIFVSHGKFDLQIKFR